MSLIHLQKFNNNPSLNFSPASFRFGLKVTVFILISLGLLLINPHCQAKSWKVLYKAQKKSLNKRTLPDHFPMEIINDVDLEGVNTKDPFLFNDFHSSGLWGIGKGKLTVTAGSDTMLKLSSSENFELEGIMNAEGLGGWYILFGWNEGHGYLIYNVTLKKSGSPWILTEIRGSKAIEGTHGEINRYDWKKDKPLQLIVKDKKVSLKIDKTMIANEVDIPNYSSGDILIGTYKTRYGPKKVKIKSLRIRTLK